VGLLKEHFLAEDFKIPTTEFAQFIFSIRVRSKQPKEKVRTLLGESRKITYSITVSRRIENGSPLDAASKQPYSEQIQPGWTFCKPSISKLYIN
jgi:hypothetical protein